VFTLYCPELVTSLPEGKPVCALTSLDDELYVARTGSRDIEVFDVDSFGLRRRLSVIGVHRRSLLVSALSFGRRVSGTVSSLL